MNFNKKFVQFFFSIWFFFLPCNLFSYRKKKQTSGIGIITNPAKVIWLISLGSNHQKSENVVPHSLRKLLSCWMRTLNATRIHQVNHDSDILTKTANILLHCIKNEFDFCPNLYSNIRYFLYFFPSFLAKPCTGTEITGLAHQLGYEREVIRIWFCNKRQALKNTVRMMSKGMV